VLAGSAMARSSAAAGADIFPALLLDDHRTSSVFAVFAQDEITLTSRLSLKRREVVTQK
jgi:hypothetical protein